MIFNKEILKTLSILIGIIISSIPALAYSAQPKECETKEACSKMIQAHIDSLDNYIEEQETNSPDENQKEVLRNLRPIKIQIYEDIGYGKGKKKVGNLCKQVKKTQQFHLKYINNGLHKIAFEMIHNNVKQNSVLATVRNGKYGNTTVLDELQSAEYMQNLIDSNVETLGASAVSIAITKDNLKRIYCVPCITFNKKKDGFNFKHNDYSCAAVMSVYYPKPLYQPFGFDVSTTNIFESQIENGDIKNKPTELSTLRKLEKNLQNLINILKKSEYIPNDLQGMINTYNGNIILNDVGTLVRND